MTSPQSSHIELALYAIKVFGNDGTIDETELNKLLEIALQDGTVDSDEKDTLRNIFNKVAEWDVQPPVWKRMQEIRAKYGF
jgi:hypothetical protein